MKRRKFITGTGALALLGAGQLVTGCKKPLPSNLKYGEILHTVIFDLKYTFASKEAKKFISDAVNTLKNLPGVENFQVLLQCSSKNDYVYGFHMIFKDQEAYDSYNKNPKHQRFVEERWNTEVTRFMEADFISFD